MKRKIEIQTDFIKLDSFLKYCGACATGGEAKEHITQGQVLVDGTVCTQRGKKLYSGMIVQFEGQEFEVFKREG